VWDVPVEPGDPREGQRDAAWGHDPREAISSAAGAAASQRRTPVAQNDELQRDCI